MAEDLGPGGRRTKSMQELRAEAGRSGTKSMLHPGQTMPAQSLAHPGQTMPAKPLAHPGQTPDAAAKVRAKGAGPRARPAGGQVTKSSSGKPLSEIVQKVATPAEGFGSRFKKAWANRGPDMQRLAKERMEKSGRKG